MVGELKKGAHKIGPTSPCLERKSPAAANPSHRYSIGNKKICGIEDVPEAWILMSFYNPVHTRHDNLMALYSLVLYPRFHNIQNFGNLDHMDATAQYRCMLKPSSKTTIFVLLKSVGSHWVKDLFGQICKDIARHQ
jgi:hypothetical protein